MLKFPMASLLCKKCEEILRPQHLPHLSLQRDGESPQRILLFESTSYHPDDGAKENCALCLLWLSAISHDEAAELRRHNEENIATIEENEHDRKHVTKFAVEHDKVFGLHINLRHISQGHKYPPSWGHVICLVPDEPSIPPEVPLSKSETYTDETWELVKYWLRECDTKHLLCRKPKFSTSQPPSRLINICSGNSSILRLQAGGTSSLKYATLSYRWGDYKGLKLNKSNKKALEKEILFPKLPKTFQDAIDVTRRLGIQYLWIDSLCIIQDCEKDKEKEIAFMYQVYSNATLNIAASDAIDSNDTFLKSREPRLLQPCQVNINWKSGYRGAYACINPYLLASVSESLLLERAWVVQERLLSARNLHFTKTQLFWECAEQQACERFPVGIISPLIDNNRNLKSLNSEYGAEMRKLSRWSAEKELNAHTLWDTIIWNYTRGDLSHETDKLPAISALARHCQGLIGGDANYLAGMWELHLASQLLWYADEDSFSRQKGWPSRQKEYRAPTWSWASVNGIIGDACQVYHKNESDILIKIHEAQTELVSKDTHPLGQVKGGYIKLSGRLARAAVFSEQSENSDYAWYYLELRTTHFTRMIGCSVYKDSSFENHSRVLGRWENLYFMPVRAEKHGCHLSGILLEDTDKGAMFHRFGMVNLFHHTESIVVEKAFEDFDLNPEEWAFESCRDEEERNLYTITIV